LFNTDDCLRIPHSGVEFNHWKTVQFNPDATADLLQGGGDIELRDIYQQKGQKFTVKPPSGLPKEIIFNTVADDEMGRVDNATRWLKNIESGSYIRKVWICFNEMSSLIQQF
jgi:hypothetical protein